MRLKFSEEINWKKRGILWVLYVVLVIFSNILTMVVRPDATISFYLIFITLVILFTAFGVYKILFYFQIQEKNYIIITGEKLTIYRGNLLSRKDIPFKKIKRVVQISDMLLVKLVNDREEQIHTEWLTEKDSQTLKRELKARLGEKVIIN